MKFNEDYKVGDYFSGVLLETFKEKGISRPRVRPVEMFSDNIRVEFPRNIREGYPIGTQFRALVKVAQKTKKTTGEISGPPYLVATNKSIDLVSDYSPIKQIFAIPIGDRVYEYISETSELTINPINYLRKKAYENSVYELKEKTTTSIVRTRSTVIRSYAIQRSKGVCEGCDTAAPFTTKNGDPYLEVHHIVQLSKGGPDHPENVAALCPNCHRRTEKSQDSEEFNNTIKKKILLLEESLGAV